MDDLRVRLVTCFQAVFPSLSEIEIPAASSSSVRDWDSVASVTLLATVEEEFGVEIDPKDMTKLLSFQRLLAYLERKDGVQR